MKISALSYILFASISHSVFACSPPFDAPFEVEPIPSTGELVPSTAPIVRVDQVHRGHRAKKGGNTCSELASVVLAVKDDSPSVPFIYSFEQVSGNSPDTIFQPGFYAGSSNGKGELLFSFYWPDLQRKPKPFSVQVKVTPYSRSGTPGPSTSIIVESEI